jgi:hypothetical protein
MPYGCDSRHRKENSMCKESSEIACNLDVIEGSLEQHQTLAHYLFYEGLKEKRDLTDGYAFRFDGSDYTKVTQYVDNERRCCSFLSFEIHVQPKENSVWLYLRGNPEAKLFLDTAFNEGKLNVLGVGEINVHSGNFLEVA